MSLSDGHFRTDCIGLEPCCSEMEAAINRQKVSVSGRGTYWIHEAGRHNEPTLAAHNCFNCGMKLEYTRSLKEAKQ